MSNSLKKRPPKNKLPVDRPFDQKVLKRARSLAEKYRIILEPEETEGYFGRAVEMPYCLGVGKTPDACVRETREVLISALATMIESGQAVPTPAGQKRQEQINIRVSPEEKLILEETARSKGFRGISDYIRNAALTGAA